MKIPNILLICLIATLQLAAQDEPAPTEQAKSLEQILSGQMLSGQMPPEQTPSEQTPSEQTQTEPIPVEQTQSEQTIPEQTPSEQTIPEQTPSEQPQADQPQVEQPQVEQPETAEKKSWLDTVEFSDEDIGTQGNWRKKKNWLKQAVEKNDSMQEIVADVQAFSQTFQDKFKALDKEIDQFYSKSGLKQESVDSLFADITKEVEATKARAKELFQAALSKLDDHTKLEAKRIKKQYVDMYGIEEKFNEQKKNLEQLKLDIQTIQNLDQSVKDRLQKIAEHNTSLQAESKNAQMLNEKIWHIIDDTKARDVFNQLSELNEKAKNIQQYVKVDLLQDFDALIKTTQGQIKKAQDSIKTLENDGVIMSNRSRRLEEQRKQQQKILKLKQELSQKLKAQEKKPKKEKSWFDTVYEFILG